MRVAVLAFANLRDRLGFGRREFELAPGTTLEMLWSDVTRDVSGGPDLRASTRFARNGVLADSSAELRDGDEIALMPPVGGG